MITVYNARTEESITLKVRLEYGRTDGGRPRYSTDTFRHFRGDMSAEEITRRVSQFEEMYDGVIDKVYVDRHVCDVVYERDRPKVKRTRAKRKDPGVAASHAYLQEIEAGRPEEEARKAADDARARESEREKEKQAQQETPAVQNEITAPQEETAPALETPETIENEDEEETPLTLREYMLCLARIYQKALAAFGKNPLPRESKYETPPVKYTKAEANAMVSQIEMTQLLGDIDMEMRKTLSFTLSWNAMMARAEFAKAKNREEKSVVLACPTMNVRNPNRSSTPAAWQKPDEKQLE